MACQSVWGYFMPRSEGITFFEHSDLHYYKTEIVYWNHIIVYKILVLDMNTWNHITVCKLFVLDWNTWNLTTLFNLFVSDEIT